jgi:hypothetical protein
MNRGSEESFFLYHNFTPRRGDRSIARGEIVLDLHATGDPLHGNQEGRFFHGYYGSYCYLPLYIFCGLWFASLASVMLEASRRLRYGARIRRACCSENSGRKRAASSEILICRGQNLASLPNIEDPQIPTLKQCENKSEQGVISEGVRNAG